MSEDSDKALVDAARRDERAMAADYVQTIGAALIQSECRVPLALAETAAKWIARGIVGGYER